MNKIAKIALGATLLLSLGTTTVSADVDKGQKYFTKKLKKVCGLSGAKMAGKHTQDDWGKIRDAGKIAEEIQAICPNIKKSALKDKYIEHYGDFFFNYASDSGNIPAC
jgi:hypothetical protein